MVISTTYNWRKKWCAYVLYKRALNIRVESGLNSPENSFSSINSGFFLWHGKFCLARSTLASWIGKDVPMGICWPVFQHYINFVKIYSFIFMMLDTVLISNCCLSNLNIKENLLNLLSLKFSFFPKKLNNCLNVLSEKNTIPPPFQIKFLKNPKQTSTQTKKKTTTTNNRQAGS